MSILIVVMLTPVTFLAIFMLICLKDESINSIRKKLEGK